MRRLLIQVEEGFFLNPQHWMWMSDKCLQLVAIFRQQLKLVRELLKRLNCLDLRRLLLIDLVSNTMGV